jgi:3-hydroxyacyl-[acyl-carrier-protein] dehydratase
MNDIHRAIPHRPPFLFVDEIVSERPDGMVCRRTFRAEDFFYAGHYPGNPITPGVILCEAAFQAAAVFLVRKLVAQGHSATGLTPVLSRIGEAKFKRMVKPGDTVEIEVTEKETVQKFHFLRGVLRKEGKPVLALEFALALLPQGEEA